MNKNFKTYQNSVPIVVSIDDEKLRYLPEICNINYYIFMNKNKTI